MHDDERDHLEEQDPDAAVTAEELASLRAALGEVTPAPVDELTRRRQIGAAVAAFRTETGAGATETAPLTGRRAGRAGRGGRGGRVVVGVFAAAAVILAIAMIVTRGSDQGPGDAPLATSGQGETNVRDLGDLGNTPDATGLSAAVDAALGSTTATERALAGPAAKCAGELGEADLEGVGNATFGSVRILVLAYEDGRVVGVDSGCDVLIEVPAAED